MTAHAPGATLSAVTEEQPEDFSNVLDNIDSERMMLPEFQRGQVWDRHPIRGFLGSLYGCIRSAATAAANWRRQE
jgi:hypothetical protein